MPNNITTAGLDIAAAAMGGSTFPEFTAIGSSTVAFSGNQTALDNEHDRNAITTHDLSTAGEITNISNFTANEVSGLVISEHGTFTLGSSMMSRALLTGSIVGDGSFDLQIQTIFQFFASGA